MTRRTAASRRAKSPGPPRPSSTRDRDLQDVRRLDWRFLLPEPELRRVVYLGPGDDALLQALRRFSRSVTILSPAEYRGDRHLDEGTFDVAVVQAPRPAALERAGSLLRGDGWIYCEVKRDPALRLFRPHTRGGDAAATAGRGLGRDPSMLLRTLGFRDVAAHWHHPDFDRCRWIVPLDGRSAGAFFRARFARSVPRPWADGLAARAVRAGLLLRRVPCVSVTARMSRS